MTNVIDVRNWSELIRIQFTDDSQANFRQFDRYLNDREWFAFWMVFGGKNCIELRSAKLTGIKAIVKIIADPLLPKVLIWECIKLLSVISDQHHFILSAPLTSVIFELQSV